MGKRYVRVVDLEHVGGLCLLTCLLGNPSVGQEATVRTGCGTGTGSKLGKA